MAAAKLFMYLLLCVLLENVGASDGMSARVWTAPSLLNNNLRLQQFSFPPPPSPPPPSPPPPPPPRPSSYAVLSDISLSSGSLVPTFNESTFTYTASVDRSVSEIQVSVTVPEDEVAAGYGVNVNGTWVESGASGPTLQLSEEGETTALTIYVLSIGYKPSLYTIYVTREESSSGGGLSAWYIALIVVACVVVLALVAFTVYWAFKKGWLPYFSASTSTGDYRSIS